MRNILNLFLATIIALVAFNSLVGCKPVNRGMSVAESSRLYAQDLWKCVIATEAEAPSRDETSFSRAATECVSKVIPQSYARENIASIMISPSLDLWKAAASGESRKGVNQIALLLRFKKADNASLGIAISFAGERMEGADIEKLDLTQMRIVFPMSAQSAPR